MYQLNIIMVTGDQIREDHFTYEKAKKALTDYERKYEDHIDVSWIKNTAENMEVSHDN